MWLGIGFAVLGIGLIGLGCVAGRLARAMGELADAAERMDKRVSVRSQVPDLDGKDVLSTALQRIRDEAENPDDAVAGFGSSV